MAGHGNRSTLTQTAPGRDARASAERGERGQWEKRVLGGHEAAPRDGPSHLMRGFDKALQGGMGRRSPGGLAAGAAAESGVSDEDADKGAHRRPAAGAAKGLSQ